MRQSGQSQLQALEQAIMTRAEELAQGFHDIRRFRREFLQDFERALVGDDHHLSRRV